MAEKTRSWSFRTRRGADLCSKGASGPLRYSQEIAGHSFRPRTSATDHAAPGRASPKLLPPDRLRPPARKPNFRSSFGVEPVSDEEEREVCGMCPASNTSMRSGGHGHFASRAAGCWTTGRRLLRSRRTRGDTNGPVWVARGEGTRPASNPRSSDVSSKSAGQSSIACTSNATTQRRESPGSRSLRATLACQGGEVGVNLLRLGRRSRVGRPRRAQWAGPAGGGAPACGGFDPGRAPAYISHAMALYRPARSSPTV